jgi:hypothetical protein
VAKSTPAPAYTLTANGSPNGARALVTMGQLLSNLFSPAAIVLFVAQLFSLAVIVLLVTLIRHLLARVFVPATTAEGPAQSPLFDWTLSKQLIPLGLN